MNILLLGNGGREHAFAWKLAESPSCEQLYIAPGNAGTAQHGVNVPIEVDDFKGLKKFALKNNIKMLIVGPEVPLVKGIYDFFANDKKLQNILVIGPSEAGAQLEGSKSFAKEFMKQFEIPTAKHCTVTEENAEDGIIHIVSGQLPVVLKADGLAAGKGVVIMNDFVEATQMLRDILEGKFGEAGKTVVVEEFLDGMEFSVFALTDGENYALLPVAKDYKRIGEGDTGLNTGGMGAVSPVPFVDDALMQKVEERIIKPTIYGIKKRGMTYKGFIFFGLIVVKDEPYVIEYNCRMGDPEAEVVLPRLKNDLVQLFQSVHDGTLSIQNIEHDPRTAAAVMLVSQGYPEVYTKGKVMTGMSEVQSSLLFHAGTKTEGEQTLTNGGRVMAVTSYGDMIKEAIETSNKNAEVIDFEGKNYRKDIGFDL